LVLLKGAIPGSEGGIVYLRDSVRRPLPEGAPLPAGMKSDVAAVAAAAPENTPAEVGEE
jgi:large subunit ribosomal protein L3